MDNLTATINIHAGNMAIIMGMSHEQILERCSIRELLLYLGTIQSLSTIGTEPAKEEPDKESVEDEKKRWARELDAMSQ